MNELFRIFRFALTAGLAAMTHLLVAETLVLAKMVGSAFEANIMAFIPAVAVSYLGHRNYTFKTRGSVGRFLVIALAGFALNNVALALLLNMSVSPAVSLLLAATLSPVLMYVGCRQLVFTMAHSLPRNK